LKGLEGEELRKQIDEMIEPGKESRFPGSGMQIKYGKPGDIIMKFKVKFPTKLSSKDKTKIQRVK
jgi:DnaJ-class molecular chaperone